MFRNFAELVWRNTPAFLRRWGVRATNTRFTVTAAGIIANPEGQVLLLKHRFRGGSGWGIPGGFIKADEQPEDGLRREICEEIGLELKTLRLYKVRTFKRARQIEIVFSCTAHGTINPQSEEIVKAEWFNLESLPQGLPTNQVPLIKDVLSRGVKAED